MNIAIFCDHIDEALLLMEQIRQNGKEHNVRLASTQESLLTIAENGNRVDLLFVDMDYHAADGLCLMQRIQEISPSTLIVCLTTSNYLILKCNEFVWKYIVKPYGVAEIKSTLTKARKVLAPQMLFLPTASSREHIMLNIHSIMYFEMFDKCGVAHTAGQEQLQFRTTLGNLEKKLKDNGFFRSHKSFLVNIAYIQCATDETITMKDGACLPLSRNRKNDFFKLLIEQPDIILV